jgi:hypothetical protein
MSLSASDNNGSYTRVPPSGKTPPPAPSAAFAKRYFALLLFSFIPNSSLSQELEKLKDWEVDTDPRLSVHSHRGGLHPTRLCPLLRLQGMAHLCHPRITLLGLEGQGLGPYLPTFNLLPNALQLPHPTLSTRYKGNPPSPQLRPSRQQPLPVLAFVIPRALWPPPQLRHQTLRKGIAD